MSSVASGGSCGSGALSAAVTAGAGPLINGQNQVAALVENAVLGGAASVAGGGKFANGAVTGAFGYLVSLGAGGSSSGGAGDPLDAHADDYPFQQAAATQGYSGQGPDIIGSLGQAWANFMSIAAPGLAPDLLFGRAAVGTGEIAWANITKGSSVSNVQIDLSSSEFVQNLLDSGYQASTSSDGAATILDNGTSRYVIRPSASGPATADYYPSGASRAQTKIRLND